MGEGAGGREISARVCEACGKAFSSDFFLSKHIGRRHPDLALQQKQLLEKKEEEEGGDSTKEPPVPEEALESREEGASGADEKEGDDEGEGEGGGAEVVEGARRLGELVREREHARFRLEMEALRKEVADLKVCVLGGGDGGVFGRCRGCCVLWVLARVSLGLFVLCCWSLIVSGY